MAAPRPTWTLACVACLVMACTPQLALAKFGKGCAPGVGTGQGQGRALTYQYDRAAFGLGFKARGDLRRNSEDYKGAAKDSALSAHLWSDGAACYATLGFCESAVFAAKSASDGADFCRTMANKAVKSGKGASQAKKFAKVGRAYAVQAARWARECAKAAKPTAKPTAMPTAKPTTKPTAKPTNKTTTSCPANIDPVEPRGLSYYYQRRAFGYGFSARNLLEKKDYAGSAKSSATSVHIYSEGTACYASLGRCEAAAGTAKSAKEEADFAQKTSEKAAKSGKDTSKAKKSAKSARAYAVKAAKSARECKPKNGSS